MPSNAPPGLDARLLRFRTRPTPEEALALGEALRAAARWHEAAEVAAAGRSGDRSDLALWILEGRARLDAGDPVAAQLAFLEGARAVPDSPRPFRWLGEVLLDRGDPQRAARVLDRALRLAAARPTVDAEDLDALPALAQRAARLARLAGPAREAPPRRAAPPVPPPTPRASAPPRPASAPPPPRVDDTPTRAPGKPPLPPVDSATRPFDAASFVARSSENDEGPTLRGPSAPAPNAARSPMDVLATLPDEPIARPDEPPGDDAPGDDGAEVELLTTDVAVDAGALGAAPPDEDPASETPEADADVPWGARLGAPEDVDEVLRVLRDAGLLEGSRVGAPPPVWASRREARPAGTRTALPFVAVWVLALAVVGAGFGLWHVRREARHARAAELVARAWDAARAGAASGRREAEALAGEAHALHPRHPGPVTARLVAAASRALDDGAPDAAELAAAVARGAEGGAEAWAIAFGRSVVASLRGADAEATARADEAVAGSAAAGREAEARWLAGRVAQRRGDDAAAAAGFTAALAAAPALAAAHLARAALLEAAGDLADARAAVDAVLAADPDHLRARLWQLRLDADARTPDAVRADLERWMPRVEADGAPVDRALAGAIRAAAARRAGDRDAAAAAVGAVLDAGAGEPGLLLHAAREAARLGRPDLAERAAALGLVTGPARADLRIALARARIDQRDGVGALEALAALPMDDPAVLRASAEAALVAGSPPALERAAEALAAAGADGEGGEDPLDAALLLRVRLRLDAQGALRTARRLLARHRDDPAVAVAAAEAFVAGGLARDALRALGPTLRADDVSPEAAWLAGRAHRLAADPEPAEAWLRRAALEPPGHLEARVDLGRLLLDLGRPGEADAVFAGTRMGPGRVAGNSVDVLVRVGRAEAALAERRPDDAASLLDGVGPGERGDPAVAHGLAAIALARGDADAALAALVPVAEANRAPPATLALLGDARAAAGDADRARARYEQALAFDAGLPEALVGLAELALDAGLRDEAQERADAADEALRARLRPPAFRARAALALGRAHLLDGRRHADEAVTALRAATALDGARGDAWCALARALELAGEADDEVAAARGRCPD